jgi:hypothetical protein
VKNELLARTAAEVCARFTVGADAKKLLGDGAMPSRQLLDQLIAKGLFHDATQLLAHTLPRREGAWWACLCARQAYGAQPPAPAAAALQAAEKWIADPSEDNRRAAFPAGEAADFGTPAGCAALAAFWSGPTIAPPHVPPVPPKEFLASIPVAGAVTLAAVLTEPHKAGDKHRRFLALGIDVAGGTNRWK